MRFDPDAHQFDAATAWCVRCGAGVEDVLNGDRAPACEPGVIGISHLVRPQLLRQLARVIEGRLTHSQPPA